ncbi:MAG: universal stress protein [Bacteroidota bacterium]
MKRWLIPLKLDGSDEGLLAYADYMAKQMCPDYIGFVHVSEPDLLPIGLGQYFPTSSRSTGASLTTEMQATVAQRFDSAIELNFKTINGRNVHSVLQETRSQKIGLTFLAWHQESSSSQTLARKIARKTSSSVWIVPSTAQASLKSAIVPVDFSIYSHRTLRLAMDLVKRGELRTVYCQHVFLGANYYQDKLVYTVDEANEKARRVRKIEADLQRYFENELSDYIATYDPTARHCLQQVDSLDHRSESVHQRILDLTDALEPDLLIMGSRGLTDAKSVMLGGVAENMIRGSIKVPILCLKRPLENRDLLDNLLSW